MELAEPKSALRVFLGVGGTMSAFVSLVFSLVFALIALVFVLFFDPRTFVLLLALTRRFDPDQETDQDPLLELIPEPTIMPLLKILVVKWTSFVPGVLLI